MSDPSAPAPDGNDKATLEDDSKATGGLNPIVFEQVKVALASFHQWASEWATRARDRAQQGFAIASTIAAALVAAGFLTNVRDAPLGVRIVGSFALAAWLVTAALFMITVTFTPPELSLSKFMESEEWTNEEQDTTTG